MSRKATKCDLKNGCNDEGDDYGSSLFLFQEQIKIQNAEQNTDTQAQPTIHQKAKDNADSRKYGYPYGDRCKGFIRLSASQEPAVDGQIHLIADHHEPAFHIAEADGIVDHLNEPVGAFELIDLSVHDQPIPLVLNGMIGAVCINSPSFVHC